METRQVQAGRDTILSLADRAAPVDAIAELIWNSLDAEAHEVTVDVVEGALGGVESVVVRDDGHGMTYEKAVETFTVHGESWKRSSRFSENIHRPMHGQLGRGRFFLYSIGGSASWRSIANNNDGNTAITITGRRDRPNAFDFDGPTPTEEPTGTTVTVQAQQLPRLTRMLDDSFPFPLTARLAPSLLGLTDVSVRYRGVSLDPTTLIERQEVIEVELEGDQLHGHGQPVVELVEWRQDMHSRVFLLCDEHGAAVTSYQPKQLPPVPIHWSVYIKWEGFRDPSLMGVADLHYPDVQHSGLLSNIEGAVGRYLARRFDERRGLLIATWKAEGVYPYHGEPQGPLEEVERDLFDVVAVVASSAVGRETMQKKFSLRLLQESVRAEPSRTRLILNAVLDLTPEDQEILAQLLDRTQLASIVRAARTVADRIDFLRGLARLLYADGTRHVFREVDQLHPMIATEPWVFGDEWTMTLMESGLRRVVEAFVKELGPDVEFHPEPVALPDGRSGRVDLVLYRYLPESDRSRHLVVQLKRASTTISMIEFGQLNNYATAITGHQQVASSPHYWDFWLVGTDIDDSVRNLYSDRSQPGLVTTTENYRIWALTWGQLIDRAERRLEAFRQQLQLSSSEADGRAYLTRVHAEYIPVGEASEPQPESA